MRHREMVLLFDCDHCGSITGQRCVTKSGATATYAHAARWNVVSAIWIEGYEEGEANVARWYRAAQTREDHWSTMETFENKVASVLEDAK